MMDKEDIKNDIKTIKDFFYEKKEISCLILFGSYVREDYSIKHSDIDLYIIVELDIEKDLKKKFEYESKIFQELDKLKLKSPFHYIFQYQRLNEFSSLLRYNILKEGKILFDKKKSFFIKKDFHLEEILFLKINYKNMVQYQKTNLKITLKKKKYILFVDFGYILIKKKYLKEFHKLSRKKEFEYKELFEFLYREKQDFD